MKKAAAKPATADALMATLKHPMKAEVEVLRKIILKAGPKLSERVKWNAPSYYYKEKDFAAFNFSPKAQDHVLLVLLFPDGLVDDPSGLLEGDWKDRRLARFHSMADVKKHKAALEKIVNDWVKLIDKT